MVLLIAQSSWFLEIQWPDTADLHSCCVIRDLQHIMLCNVALHRPACSSVFVQGSLPSLAVFCSTANWSKKLVLDFVGQTGRWAHQPTLLIVSVILSFLFLLKGLSHAYKWILIAHLNGKWKWKTYSIILSLYRAEFSHAYLCINGSLVYLAH